VREFGFEVALCAQLEREDRVVARQLGASTTGRRVIDIACVEPGPAFEDRAAITPYTIPDRAIESSIGVGRWRHWSDALLGDSDWAREATARAVEMGFFERTRRAGRELVRQARRYPEDWFGAITGIENKPDLESPGDLERQLRTDVSLGLFDRVVLATESYVTRAHLNRLPPEVGVWRFDPASDERETVREPTTLDSRGLGIEVRNREPARTDFTVVPPARKAVLRRRLAERAYGKGWRTYQFPDCGRVSVGEAAGTRSIPRCSYYNRTVRPATECGPACPGYERGEPPAFDADAERDRRTPWVRNPTGVSRTQSGLDRFG
jgi:hypothetical protein